MSESDWIPIAKAVIVTELTDRTLRRWIVKGKLPSRKKSGKVYVNLSGLGYDLSDIDKEPVQTIDDAVTIARLQGELDGLLKLVNSQGAEIDNLRQTLQNEQSTLMAMTANHQKLIEATSSQPKSRTWKFWRW